MSNIKEHCSSFEQSGTLIAILLRERQNVQNFFRNFYCSILTHLIRFIDANLHVSGFFVKSWEFEQEESGGFRSTVELKLLLSAEPS